MITSLPVGAADDTATARYSGPISAENNRAFFAILGDRPIRRLRIDSSGGEVAAGIELGRWVSAQGLDVVVGGQCLSSCANYVFTAGRNKVIEPDAVVAWHGNYHHLQATGLWRDDIASHMRRTGEDEPTATRHVRAQMEELVALERGFFAQIGVDQRLCWVGKMPPYAVPDYYLLSAQDMARFGVTSVQEPAGYMDRDLSSLDVNVVPIRLLPE